MLEWLSCISGIEDGVIPRGKSISRVPGLWISKQVVSETEEAALLSAIDEDECEWIVRRTRVTKNYGPFYVYGVAGAREARGVGHEPVPQWARGFLANRSRSAFGIDEEWRVNQAHVALYRDKSGHQIRLHNDCSMGRLNEAVVGISLGAKCAMTFAHPKDGRTVVVQLPRRSAYCLRGEALTVWRHGIRAKHVRGDRVSITLRHLDELYVPNEVSLVHNESFQSNLVGHVKGGLRLRDVVQVEVDEEEVKQVRKMHGFDRVLPNALLSN